MSGKCARVAWLGGGSPASLLQRLNDATELNERGSISFIRNDHRELFELLAHQICFPEGFSYRDVSAISYRAYLDLRKEGAVDQKSLISLIAQRVEQWKTRPLKTYTMWTKMRLSQMASASGLRFQFDGVFVRTVANLPKWLSLETNFISGIGDVNPNVLPFFGYAILSTKARSENEASDKLFIALDKFYAIVNTSWRFNEFWISHRPSSILLHGPNYFFFENKKFLGQNRAWFNQDFDEKEWTFSPKTAADFSKNADLFKRAIKRLECHPLRVPLERAIVLVSEGMMSSRLSFRLMRFWSAAEALYTKENSQTPYDRLIDRMLFAEAEDEISIERLKLKRASELRNQYVHRGLTEKENSSLIQNLRETILRFAYYILFNGDDFRKHAELLEMIEPSNAPHKVAEKLLAIERRRKIVETGRHKDV